MQVSSLVTSLLGSITSAKASQTASAASASTEEFKAASETESTAETKSTVADVFARYDLASISPREVDQMAAELRDAGFEDDEFLLTLETHGEKFQSFGALAFTEAGYPAEAPDANAAQNLYDQVSQRISQSRRLGNPTESLQTFLDAMRSHSGSGADTLLATSSATAETVVAARAAG